MGTENKDTSTDLDALVEEIFSSSADVNNVDTSQEKETTDEPTVEEVQGEEEGEIVEQEQDEQETQKDDIKSTLETLMEVVRQQQEEIQNLKAAGVTQKKEPDPVDTIQDVQFLSSDEEIGEHFASAESINALLNKVLKKGVALGREISLKDMPNIATRELDTVLRNRTAAANFYKEHPEYAGHKEKVAEVASRLWAANPQATTEQIFAALPKYVAQELKGKVKPAVKQTPNVPTTSNRPSLSKTQMTRLERDVADLLS